MVRSIVTAFLLLTFVQTQANTKQLSNKEFCLRGIDSLATVIIDSLAAYPTESLFLSNIQGRFGEALRGRLAEALMKNGKSAYLEQSDPTIGSKFLLQSVINDYSLKYVGIGGSMFRQGKVSREFSVDTETRLLQSDGKLYNLARRQNLVVTDTLSYDMASKARGEDSFLAPDLPPTTFQRMVEPGLIIGITGALVYLFFAAR